MPYNLKIAPYQGPAQTSALDGDAATKAVIDNEHLRIKTILSAAEARLVPDVAASLAFDTHMPAAAAIELMQVAAKPLQASQKATNSAMTAATSQEQIDADWREAAQAAGIALKLKAAAPAVAHDQESTGEQSDLDRDWADAAASAGIPRK